MQGFDVVGASGTSAGGEGIPTVGKVLDSRASEVWNIAQPEPKVVDLQQKELRLLTRPVSAPQQPQQGAEVNDLGCASAIAAYLGLVQRLQEAGGELAEGHSDVVRLLEQQLLQREV